MSDQPAIYPQAGNPRPKKPWYKKIWVWLIVGIVIVAAAAAAGGGKTPTSSTQPSAEQPSTAVGIGTAMTSGPFEFTVTEVKSALTVLGKDPITTKPQGQFVVITMSVKNIGKKATYFSSSSVKLLSADRTEYDVSSSASIYLGEGSAIFEQINPGNSLTGMIAFDIPKDVVATTLQFSGGIFDKAVEVRLT